MCFTNNVVSGLAGKIPPNLAYTAPFCLSLFSLLLETLVLSANAATAACHIGNFSDPTYYTAASPPSSSQSPPLRPTKTPPKV